MKMAAGALVVLFHPSEEHVDNLLRLKRLVEDIVAVDNSPELDVSELPTRKTPIQPAAPPTMINPGMARTAG